MSLKRRFATAVTGVGAAIAISGAAMADTQNNQETTTGFDTQLAQAENTSATEVATFSRPELPSISQDIQNRITFRQHAMLIHEVGSAVFQLGYVVLTAEEINERYWNAIDPQHIIAAGFDVDQVPDSPQDLVDALETIYYDVLLPQDISGTEFFNGLVGEFLASIDAHSTYAAPTLAQDAREETRGAFGGLGIQINRQENTGYIEILDYINMIGNSPAESAGVEEGDLITHIDGQDISEMEFTDAIDLMKGAPGSDVTLTIIREGEAQPIDIEVTRRTIRISPSSSETLADGRVGYVSLSSFTAQAGFSIERLISEMENSDNPPESYILDLRFNPGGLLREAARLADDFLEAGDIVSQGTRNGPEALMKARAGDIINGKPLVVLVNSYSASASEILSGVLQTYNRAIVVGTNSFGKGSVQTVMPLSSNGGQLSLTTALYYIGEGQSIQNRGVEPDINVRFGRAALIEEGRQTEATQRNTILDQLSPDQIIDDADYECVLNGSFDDVLNQLDNEYKTVNGQTGDTTIDSTLLCAVEHLTGASDFTIRQLEAGAPQRALPAVTLPTGPR